MNLLRSLNSLRFAAAAGAALLAAAAMPASASSFKTIRSFCHPQFCADGSKPTGTLLQDSAQRLYGTTEAGGANNAGTVYRLVENPTTHNFGLKVIYNFCNKNDCEDGGNPIRGRLIVDTTGRLYGVASIGGTTGNGVIYTLTPNAQKTHYTYAVIYNFCDKFTGCEDGSSPIGGLTYKGQQTGAAYDGVSPLYGVTKTGGRKHEGVVYQLILSNQHFFQKILYVFCSINDTSDCGDGRQPNENLSFDRTGDLYGTTAAGGNATDFGVVYKLIPTQQGHWAILVIHSFCADATCSDGKTPTFGTIIDNTGNVFGITTQGGTADAAKCPQGCGLVFKVTPGGSESTAYSFCSQANCTDGAAPAGLTIDSNNNIFGTTNVGGLRKHGTIFELNAAFVSLYDFKCKHKDCRDGVTSTGALVEYPNGDLFGVLQDGGHFGATGGTAFRFTP